MKAATIAFQVLVLLLARPAIAGADELRVWVSRAIATVLGEIGAEFERTTGHRLVVSSGLPPGFAGRAAAGERFDLLISGSVTVDEWIAAGRLIGSTRTDIARSGIGVEVRAGAPKPDISTVEAFKRAILEAQSIAYLKVGSGVYLDGLFYGLKIADAVRAKAIRPDTDIVSELVAQGKVELGLVVITQILTTPGVELVGPLPAEIQSYVTFTAAISAGARASAAARQLIEFLKGPVAVPVIRAQGMEPIASRDESSQSGPDSVMRQFFQNLSSRRWEEAAAALDLSVLGAFRESVLSRSQRVAPQREPTVEDLLRLDPDMPRAVAEYQLSQRRRVLDDYPLPAIPEFPDIPSHDSLRALPLLALGVSWLQSRDNREGMLRDLRRLKCPPNADSLLLAELTMDPKVLGVAGASDSVAYVLFSDPQFDRPTREFYSADPMMARMRRTATGWRIIPTSTFLTRVNTISQLASCPGQLPRRR